jgi:hypothetical protein
MHSTVIRIAVINEGLQLGSHPSTQASTREFAFPHLMHAAQRSVYQVLAFLMTLADQDGFSYELWCGEVPEEDIAKWCSSGQHSPERQGSSDDSSRSAASMQTSVSESLLSLEVQWPFPRGLELDRLDTSHATTDAEAAPSPHESIDAALRRSPPRASRQTEYWGSSRSQLPRSKPLPSSPHCHATRSSPQNSVGNLPHLQKLSSCRYEDVPNVLEWVDALHGQDTLSDFRARASIESRATDARGGRRSCVDSIDYDRRAGSDVYGSGSTTSGRFSSQSCHQRRWYA